MPSINPFGNKFVHLIEDNHQEIIERFMNDVLKNPKTPSYKKLEQKKLYEIGDRVYRELSKFIMGGYKKEEIETMYRKLGHTRYNEGIPYYEVFEALVLTKRHVWLFIENHIENEFNDYKEAMVLVNKVVLFFDRASLAMLKGYHEVMFKKF